MTGRSSILAMLAATALAGSAALGQEVAPPPAPPPAATAPAAPDSALVVTSDPAAAEQEPPRTPDHLARLTVYGNDPCPRGSGDEIVVCAREPESERFRIPKKLRQSKDKSWSDTAHSLEYVGASGTASCSPVGGGGWTGCQNQLLRQAREERKQRKAEAEAIPGGTTDSTVK